MRLLLRPERVDALQEHSVGIINRGDRTMARRHRGKK